MCYLDNEQLKGSIIMGWDFLISSFIADLIVNRKEKKTNSFVPMQNSFKSSVSERMFVNARNKTIIAEYIPIQMEWFNDPATYHFPLPLFILTDEQQLQLKYYYSRLSTNPNLVDSRTALIHYLFKLWRDENKIGLINLIQNEVLYMIDYISPNSQQERMYQHLAMFISSECYFFKGDFTNAIKRLYQTLDWQEIYDNIEEKDGSDFNGLSFFHHAVIANIINIYALVGLPEKADEMRNACRITISAEKASNASLLSASNNDENYREFVRNTSKVFDASTSLFGYYTFENSWYNENFFKEVCTSVIRGQAIYSIETSLFATKEIVYEDAKGIFDDVFGTYPSLRIGWRGHIINYKEAINRCREEISKI